MTLKQFFCKLRMGRLGETWDDLPEKATPGIWTGYGAGGAGLEQMFLDCTAPRVFLSWLLFSHLLDPDRTPPECREWLLCREVCKEFHCALPLEELEKGRWRRVPVPMVAGGKGAVKWMLVGVGDGLPLFPAGGEGFAPESVEAAHGVRKLVFETWQQSFCVWPMRPSTVTGTSLGLPLYLGAAAACLGLPGDRVAATGALRADGEVLRVEGVREKALALPGHIEIFLCPGDLPRDAAPESGSGFQCVCVDRVTQAVAMLYCEDPQVAQVVRTVQGALEAGAGVAVALCVLRPGSETWVRHNREQIGRALFLDDEIQELITKLKNTWCNSTTGTDVQLGNAILDCIDIRTGRRLQEADAQAAWELAQLQMSRANHRGDIETVADWCAIADALAPTIMGVAADGEGEHLIHFVHRTISDCHNWYRFDPDYPDRLLDSMDLREILDEKKERFQRKQCRIGNCRDQALGKYYGTMGQHYLFCGPEFFDRGVEFLDRALLTFGNGMLDEASQRDWKQDQLYKVFGYLEVGRFQEAETLLGEICGRGGSMGEGWPVSAMNFFEQHCLLRLHVDGNIGLESECWGAITKSAILPEGHPGQLLAYNLARLAVDSADRRQWYAYSLHRCLSPGSGPTIRAMALLPLSRMHAEGMDLPDMGEKCDEVRGVLESGGLHTEHFRSVLDAGSWQEMLHVVIRRERELFPYMYR